MLLKGLDDGDADACQLERSDPALQSATFDSMALDTEPEFWSSALSPSPRPTIRADKLQSVSADLERKEVDGKESAAVSTSSQRVKAFSRGLVDTYFRQMGDAAWLSREEEIALSQRIEASQRAMLIALCRLPALVERIGQWAREVMGGQFRLADLFDLSLAGSEPDSPDQAHDRDTVADAEISTRETASSGVVGEAAVTIARLQAVIALVDEVGSLSQKRLLALCRSRDLSKRHRDRLHNLTSRLADEMETLRLHPDRLPRNHRQAADPARPNRQREEFVGVFERPCSVARHPQRAVRRHRVSPRNP